MGCCSEGSQAAASSWIPPGLLGDANATHHWGQHFGIFFIELGVLLTVSATMVTIFYGFTGRMMDGEAATR